MLTIRFLLAFFCSVGFTMPAAAQLLSPRAFTQEFMGALRAQAPELQVTTEGDTAVKLKDARGRESNLFLDNAYASYSADSGALTQIIQKYVAAILEERASIAPVDRSRIVPVVKDRAWLAEIQAALKARGMNQALEHVFEDLNEDLVIVYAEDSPRNIRYITPKSLTELGVKKEQLRSIAVTNLQNLLPRIEARPAPLVSMITAGGDYEASLLLFDRIWSGGQLVVDGDIVVAVPARDLLLFTGSKNRAGIAKLREIAAKAASEASYRLTDRLFVYRDGQFRRFEP